MTRRPAESRAMALLHRAGLESAAWSLRRLHCPVPSDALVLEVGSGGNPYPRADVLLDAYEVTRERHWVPLAVDRPTVLGFVERLPFRDNAFDFIIASHVLEHSADPARFLSELQRVGRAGYIEVPDAFFERINPYRDHRLEITLREGRLRIRKKTAWTPDADLVDLYEARAKSLFTRELMPRHPFAFHVRHFWAGAIDYEIMNPEADAGWAASPPDPGERAPAIPFKTRILNWLRPLLSRARAGQPVDLAAVVICPDCSAEKLTWQAASITCNGCQAVFAIVNGIPVLHPTQH